MSPEAQRIKNEAVEDLVLNDEDTLTRLFWEWQSDKITVNQYAYRIEELIEQRIVELSQRTDEPEGLNHERDYN